MPIIVDPGFVPPSPPASVTGADGVLTATLRPDSAGVLLVADFSGAGTVPTRVRFERADGSLVRSGDSAWAPGGVAVAYDGEAPLGETVSWVAYPILADGTVGSASDAAALAVPDAASSTVWLKPVSAPGLSAVFKIALAEDSGTSARAGLSPVAGSSSPTGSWDVPVSEAYALTLRTDTEAEAEALRAIFAAGPVVLVQSPACSGIPRSMFVTVQGAPAPARMVDTGFGWALRAWNVTVQTVARPATVDAPLVIPGSSWGTLTDSYASWSAVVAADDSWLTAVVGS